MGHRTCPWPSEPETVQPEFAIRCSVRALCIFATLAACDFTPGRVEVGAIALVDGAVDAVPDVPIDAAPPSFHLRVEAHMDGRSQLIFRGTTVQWHHFQFAAPGREVFMNLPTKFDGVDWQPVWPDVPDAENRDCDCMSDTYETLPLAVPRLELQATVTAIATRKPPTVIQQPTQQNDFTLIVELTDVGVGGSAWNTVDIDVVVP